MFDKFSKLQILFFAGLLLGTAASAQADELRVAVAGNFSACLAELAETFEAQTNHTLITSVGSTGKHYAQIKLGAPFDIFLAADKKRPHLLENEGLTVAGSRFTYAVGQLVLWRAKSEFNSEQNFSAILAAGDFRYLAIANPRLAPYGLAAEQVLKHQELIQT